MVPSLVRSLPHGHFTHPSTRPHHLRLPALISPSILCATSSPSPSLRRPRGMPDFHLFRVRVEASRQTDLWYRSSTTDSPILTALEENPTAHSRRSGQWHIGGLVSLPQRGYYFKLGRITKRIEPQWDPDRHDFIDVEKEPAPYTHALLDLPTQVCGLALNPDIASTVRTLGHRLAMLL